MKVSPSEASVERTFKTQDDIHRQDRNRLSRESIKASVFVSNNYRLPSRDVTTTEVQVIDWSRTVF